MSNEYVHDMHTMLADDHSWVQCYMDDGRKQSLAISSLRAFIWFTMLCALYPWALSASCCNNPSNLSMSLSIPCNCNNSNSNSLAQRKVQQNLRRRLVFACTIARIFPYLSVGPPWHTMFPTYLLQQGWTYCKLLSGLVNWQAEARS